MSSLPGHNFRVHSELQIGTLGTYSGAEALQRKAHRRSLQDGCIRYEMMF